MNTTKKKPGRPRTKAIKTKVSKTKVSKTKASKTNKSTSNKETLIERAERIKELWSKKGYIGNAAIFNINAMIRAYNSGDRTNDIVKRLKDLKEPG